MTTQTTQTTQTRRQAGRFITRVAGGLVATVAGLAPAGMAKRADAQRYPEAHPSAQLRCSRQDLGRYVPVWAGRVPHDSRAGGRDVRPGHKVARFPARLSPEYRVEGVWSYTFSGRVDWNGNPNSRSTPNPNGAYAEFTISEFSDPWRAQLVTYRTVCRR